jgi:hypothetical protein
MVNDGLFVRWRPTLWVEAPTTRRADPMRSTIRLTITIKVEVALSVSGLLALLWLLS